jgi:hypothetical protein
MRAVSVNPRIDHFYADAYADALKTGEISFVTNYMNINYILIAEIFYSLKHNLTFVDIYDSNEGSFIDCKKFKGKVSKLQLKEYFEKKW